MTTDQERFNTGYDPEQTSIFISLFEKSVQAILVAEIWELLTRDLEITDDQITLRDDGTWESNLLTRIENGEATEDDFEVLKLLLEEMTFVLNNRR